MAGFDPYHKWLGIPPEEQPANLYRLLGISLFESDPDVIDSAADKQMTFLRSCANGPHVALSQQLLNEVAAARLCLLNAAERSRYDDQLRAKLAAPQSSSSRTEQPRTESIRGAQSNSNNQSSLGARFRFVAIATAGLLTCMAAAYFLFGRNPAVLEQNPRDATASSSAPTKSDRKVNQRNPAESQVAIASKSASIAAPPDQSGGADVTRTASKAADDVPDDNTSASRTADSKVQDAPASPAAVAPNTDPSDLDSKMSDASDSAPERLPVPNADSQAQSIKDIRAILTVEFDGAKAPSQKRDLARKLLVKAGESNDDAVGGFVLRDEARQLAIAAGDAPLAFGAIDELQATYEVDAIKLQADTAAALAKTARLQSQKKSLAEELLNVIDAILMQEHPPAEADYAVAGQLATIAQEATRAVSDASLTKRVAACNQTVETRKRLFAEVQKSLRTLETLPEDPTANLVVGSYECFLRSEWSRGLPRLARSTDAALKALAVKELAGPLQAHEQLAIADGWWDVAETRIDGSKTIVQRHAVKWYARAVPQLTGLSKEKAAQRVEQVVSADRQRTVPGRSRVSLEGATAKQAPVRKSAKSAAPRDAVALGQKRFKLFLEPLTWHAARARCVKLRGRLAQVRSQEENDLIVKLARARGIDGVWLGASDEAQEGRWLWNDGSNLTWSNWGTDQPNNWGPGGEHYLMLMIRTYTGKWWDLNVTGVRGFSSDWRVGFACEWDAADVGSGLPGASPNRNSK